MSDSKTVIYVSSIDEAAELCSLHIPQSHTGEDWGLITHGDDYTQVKFVSHNTTLTLTTEQYDMLCEYPGSEEITVERATEQVLEYGASAILDIRVGKKPLQGIDTVLEKAVASVFVMQAETGSREWPTVESKTDLSSY